MVCRYALRLGIFTDNLAFIAAENTAAGGVYTLAINAFADLSKDEFAASHMGLQKPLMVAARREQDDSQGLMSELLAENSQSHVRRRKLSESESESNNESDDTDYEGNDDDDNDVQSTFSTTSHWIRGKRDRHHRHSRSRTASRSQTRPPSQSVTSTKSKPVSPSASTSTTKVQLL